MTTHFCLPGGSGSSAETGNNGGTGAGSDRKIQAEPEKIEALLIELGVAAIPRASRVIVLDFDATGGPIHGGQEGRLYHGYYESYCYLPLYCFGLARSARLQGQLGPTFAQVHDDLCYHEIGLCAMMAEAGPAPGEGAPCGASSSCATGPWTAGQKSAGWWARPRSPTAKRTRASSSPTSPARRIGARARRRSKTGAPSTRSSTARAATCDMGNRIREQPLDLFADRTSTGVMAGNQLRLWFSTFAYMLVRRLRAVALCGADLAKGTAGTIRVRLMKIAALVEVGVRRTRVRLAGACPMAAVFAAAHRKLREHTWEDPETG